MRNEPTPEVKWRFPGLRTVITPLLGAAAVMMAGVYIVLLQWVACGINQPALIAQIGILKYFPISFGFGLAILFIASTCLIKVRGRIYYPLMALATCVALWAFLVFSFNQYNDYPPPSGNTCTDGLPAWWPSLIPIPFF